MNKISKSFPTLPRVRNYHKQAAREIFKATRNENDKFFQSIRNRRFSTVLLQGLKKKHLNFLCRRGNSLKYSCRTNSNYYHGSEYGRSYKTENEITDEVATKILRKYEMSVTMKEDFDNKNLNPVISFESNILPSNSPLEDRRAQAKFHHNTDLSMLFGVFDGHGGHQCSHAVSTRLFLYIALALLPHEQLESTLKDLEKGKRWPALLEWYQHSKGPAGTSLQSHQVARLRRFMEKRLSKEIVIEGIEDALRQCCTELDNDILNDAEHQTEYKTMKHANPDLAAIDCAMSGCVSCVAHFAGDIVTVANVGDCQAVLGSRDLITPGKWIATPLSHKHNSMNQEERRRILSEHPEAEQDSIIRNDRLLGSLAPFRAFGNARFKWPAALINEVATLSFDSHSDIGVGGDYRIPDQVNWVLPNYRTPPYLTSKPDLVQHELQPNDAFIVLATDGLWDTMRKRDIVQITGEFIDRSENRYNSEKQSEFYTESCDVMDSDTAFFGMEDTNCATHIIRHAIGQTFDGASRRQVRAMLNLSKEESRSYRDDITVTVVKLNPLVL